jgi:hypothetical protein
MAMIMMSDNEENNYNNNNNNNNNNNHHNQCFMIMILKINENKIYNHSNYAWD